MYVQNSSKQSRSPAALTSVCASLSLSLSLSLSRSLSLALSLPVAPSVEMQCLLVHALSVGFPRFMPCDRQMQPDGLPIMGWEPGLSEREVLAYHRGAVLRSGSKLKLPSAGTEVEVYLSGNMGLSKQGNNPLMVKWMAWGVKFSGNARHEKLEAGPTTCTEGQRVLIPLRREDFMSSGNTVEVWAGHAYKNGKVLVTRRFKLTVQLPMYGMEEREGWGTEEPVLTLPPRPKLRTPNRNDGALEGVKLETDTGLSVGDDDLDIDLSPMGYDAYGDPYGADALGDLESDSDSVNFNRYDEMKDDPTEGGGLEIRPMIEELYLHGQPPRQRGGATPRGGATRGVGAAAPSGASLHLAAAAEASPPSPPGGDGGGDGDGDGGGDGGGGIHPAAVACIAFFGCLLTTLLICALICCTGKM